MRTLRQAGLIASCLSCLVTATTWAATDTTPEPPTQSLEAINRPTSGIHLPTRPVAIVPVLPVPPLPEAIPAAIAPDPAGLVGLYPEQGTDLGVGHLRPKDLTSLQAQDWVDSPIADANWLQGVVLPIYAQPEGEPWGWFANGWLITEQAQPLAVGRDATFSMLHTYAGLYTFPVMEIRPDGWFRFRYTPAGTAWAHLSQLNLGPIELTVEPWEDRFLSAGQLEFRRHGATQALLPQPAAGESMQALIGPHSLIEPLEFEGDWMRVRVTQPVDACAPLPGANTEEGWVRWRNNDHDSLVWFPPKGC